VLMDPNWKTTSIFGHMEDDLQKMANGRQPQLLRQMEYDLNFLGKYKTA
jgi:hypothetical protein